MKYNKNEVTGKMRDRIILQNVNRSRSLTGFASESWADIATIWAFAESKLPGSNETIIEGKNTAKNICDFTIRYISSITEESRVVFKNKIYQVKNIKISHDRRFISFQGVYYDSYSTVIGLQLCSASLLAQSSLSAALMRVIKYQASLNAFGSVSADINFVQKVASSLNAFGTLTGDITFVKNMQAALNGTAALSGGITFVQKPEASLNAFGTLVGDLKIAKTFESSLNANGTLVSNATIAKNLASSLTSSNSLAANALVSKLASASLTGAGTTAANLTVQSAASLLLDIYPSAAAAYSLRKLRSAYTGSAIRVRRSSDNTEQNIGFVAEQLDTESLLSFCGVGNGFVTTWYDQSGNAQNATMSTQANQPQIVSSGVVVTQNGKPTLQYDGTNDGLNATVTGINNTTALCLFYAYSSNLAAANDTNTASLWLNGDFGLTSLRGHFSSTGILQFEYVTLDTRKTINAGGRIGSTTYRRSANTLVVENTFYLENGTSFQQNNNNINLNLLSETTLSENLTPNAYNTSTNLYIGYLNYGVFANQKISEFIVYLSNQTTNRSNINANINTHYAIY